MTARSARRLAIAGVGLGIVGFGLLVIAKLTPRYTDAKAYFAKLNEMPRGETGDSHAFFANLERFQTHKWLYADLGYLLVAWAILLLVLIPTALKRHR